MKTNLKQHLTEECIAMAKHCSANGKKLPVSTSLVMNINDLSETKELTDDELLKLHHALSKLVFPARPKTIWLLCKESNIAWWLKFLGPVGLVRRMMLTTLVSLCCFIFVSMSSDISTKNISEGIYKLSGITLLLLMIFYLSASSMGACFSNLFLANRFIANNTYDPQFESSYWVRFVLGIIAGIMLSVIIPVPDQEQLAVVSRPVLAMLGGFSASLVYRILFRMVYAVESLFIGKQNEAIDQKLQHIKASNDIEIENIKQQHLNKLVRLQFVIQSDSPKNDIDAELKKIIDELSEQ